MVNRYFPETLPLIPRRRLFSEIVSLIFIVGSFSASCPRGGFATLIDTEMGLKICTFDFKFTLTLILGFIKVCLTIYAGAPPLNGVFYAKIESNHFEIEYFFHFFDNVSDKNLTSRDILRIAIDFFLTIISHRINIPLSTLFF